MIALTSIAVAASIVLLLTWWAMQYGLSPRTINLSRDRESLPQAYDFATGRALWDLRV